MGSADIIIGIANVVAQLAVAGVAVWAVLASLHANKKQIESSDKQLKEQIKTSEIQIHQQIEENRRLATEEHQHQSRPILVPKKEIFHRMVTYVSMETGKPVDGSEHLYTSKGEIDWSWPHEIYLNLYNMGNGPAFNLHGLLYGPQLTCLSQFVSWNNSPIEEKSPIELELIHSPELELFQDDSVDGKHPLYDRSLNLLATPEDDCRIACLTITYHDLFGKKHMSIFHYTLRHQWIHVKTGVIPGGLPLDLKELNDREKQGLKLSAPHS